MKLTDEQKEIICMDVCMQSSGCKHHDVCFRFDTIEQLITTHVEQGKEDVWNVFRLSCVCVDPDSKRYCPNFDEYCTYANCPILKELK
jgi:hypothetical protein